MSLLDQTIKPNRTILWVATNDCSALPQEVLALQKYGLEIQTCEDIRSYKKLIPTLRLAPEACIVTADDDVYYPPNWLAKLTNHFAARRVVGMRCNLARLNAVGTFEPYATWQWATAQRLDAPPYGLIFPTGVGGVLYAPGVFMPDIGDENQFMSLCPTADDVWFFWSARRNGATFVNVNAFDMVTWPSSQNISLFSENVLEGSKNDAQIAEMQRVYGRVDVSKQ